MAYQQIAPRPLMIMELHKPCQNSTLTAETLQDTTETHKGPTTNHETTNNTPLAIRRP